MSKKSDKITGTSPRGAFKYTHLNKPDTRYKETGEFSVQQVIDLSTKAGKDFKAKLDDLHEQLEEKCTDAFDNAKAAQKSKWSKKGIDEPTANLPYTEEYDADDVPTGNIIVKFKTNASFTDRKTGETVKKKVKFSDPKGNVIPTNKVPLVYAGSVGRIAYSVGFSFIPKDAEGFVSFYLNEVNLLEVVSGGGGSGSAFADDADEDADWSVEDLEEYEGSVNDDADDEDVDDDDDDIDDEIPF
ncbi:MAG: hypothetical protein AAFQ32_04475 [Pseudomonadota bacterium]